MAFLKNGIVHSSIGSEPKGFIFHFSEKAHFEISRYGNIQNFQIWSKENL